MQLTFRLAWRNLWRHGRRSLITASAMAVAVALCMAMLAFNDGMYAKLFDVMVEQQLGHLQIHHPAYPTARKLFDTVPDAASTMQRVLAHDQVLSASAKLNGFALIGGRDESAGGQLVGIEPGRESAVTRAHERIVEGRFLEDGKLGEIVLGVGLAKEISVGVGDEVVVVTQASDGSMGNALYQVVGLFRTGSAALDKSGSMMHLADLQELLVLPDQVHQITVLGDDATDLPPLRDAVRGLIPKDSEVLTWDEASPQTAQLIGMQTFASGIVLGIVFAVASFGVLNTMMMSVFERTRELGVLMAIGLRPGRLIAMVIAESICLSAVAGGLGLVLGGLLDVYIVTVGIDMSAGSTQGFTFAGVTMDPVMRGRVEPSGILLVMVSLVVVSVLASLWPAWRASRLIPVHALRAD
jgi:ABC-type lipoprotein release transport system permease subunit